MQHEFGIMNINFVAVSMLESQLLQNCFSAKYLCIAGFHLSAGHMSCELRQKAMLSLSSQLSLCH
jgi:hypothetical protein